MYVIVYLFSLFLYYYCFAVFWYWCIGYNMNVGICRLFIMVWLIGKGFIGNGQWLFGGNIG